MSDRYLRDLERLARANPEDKTTWERWRKASTRVHDGQNPYLDEFARLIARRDLLRRREERLVGLVEERSDLRGARARIHLTVGRVRDGITWADRGARLVARHLSPEDFPEGHLRAALLVLQGARQTRSATYVTRRGQVGRILDPRPRPSLQEGEDDSDQAWLDAVARGQRGGRQRARDQRRVDANAERRRALPTLRAMVTEHPGPLCPCPSCHGDQDPGSASR